jgi:adenylate cyclase, class 2
MIGHPMSAMTASAPMIETEVKFHLPDPGALRTRLLALGAQSLGRCREHNLRFDAPDRRLSQGRSLLRLRQDRHCTLTFKSAAPEADPAFKQMVELEVQVSDFERMLSVLAALGFEPVQAYEKWRESFQMGDTVFCLDELPYGHFLEIEGSPEAIVAAGESLGLPWEKRILLTYLDIFERLRRQYALTFDDLTFDRFRRLPVDLAPLLPEMEAGPGR